jgi:adenylylsulfate kinase-like enzyme
MPGPAVIQLLGYPGSGKYTVGREIVLLLGEQGHEARLLDNHATANLIIDLVPPMPDRYSSLEMLERIGDIRRIVLTSIERLSPPEWTFVFTNFLPTGVTPAHLDRHRALAEARRTPFIPVLLACDHDELLRRVSRPERAGRRKLVDEIVAREVIERGMTMPDWNDITTIDVTHREPHETAALIIDLMPPA